MNRYTVTWRKLALHALAQIYNDALDKNAVTDAANHIDRLLAIDPANQGEPALEGVRGLHIAPLHVLFIVQELDRLVDVMSVRRDPYPPRSEVNGQAPPNQPS